MLLGSVISAAFIGPGTVTSAAVAGADFGLSLLWALTFSTLACLVLQESAARLAATSGLDLGQALRAQYAGRAAGWFVLPLVFGAIVLGCAAYQAGNIVGAVAGAALAVDWPRKTLTLVIGLLAATLLWSGGPRRVARVLAALVAVMGAAFLVSAWRLGPAARDVLAGALIPARPQGSDLVVLGLIGTTVVPYNLFLGAGIARGESLDALRFGLGVAVLLGGVISMGVVVCGTAVTGAFDFEALAGVLAERLGPAARGLFAAGLFAAGLSSAVTAPLAAAITTRGLFAAPHDPRWADGGRRFRAVWGAVLVVGLGLGLADVRPVSAILLAQALNGVLLPLAALFLLLATNDRRMLGPQTNGFASNAAMAAVLLVTFVLGARHATVAGAAAAGLELAGPRLPLAVAAIGVTIAVWPVMREIRRRRRA